MQTVFIWPNSGKSDIKDAVMESCALLKGLGVRVILPEEDRFLCSPQMDVCYATQEDGIIASDFIVSLGGDGTILRIAELAARYQKPLIGVNLGHIGFMTELERGEIPKLRKIIAGKYNLDQRMMLELTVLRGDKPLYCQHALNDIVLTKSNPFRVIHIEVHADGAPVTSFYGDGVIIATPTGTTAYSLSAGGPVIEPSAENIAVTPVCAHHLQAQSFVFGPEREINIVAHGPERHGICIATDGRSGVELQEGDQILIRRSKLMTRLIRVKGRSFYHLLRYKLSNGGSDA